MLKMVRIIDDWDGSVESYIIDTELSDNIDIIERVININSSIEYCRDFTNNSFFDMLDWRSKFYDIEDVCIYKI